MAHSARQEDSVQQQNSSTQPKSGVSEYPTIPLPECADSMLPMKADDPLGDFFDTPEIDMDVFFGSDVDALVVSAYKAALDGINRLDSEKRPRPNLKTNPEADVELDLWDQQIADMKRLAGNMALVSLITFFDDWLTRKHWQVFSCDGHDWKQRFQSLQKKKQGPLTLERMEQFIDARNSIIHNQGEPRFDWNGRARNVSERFLDFDDVRGRDRVGITDLVLAEVTQELAAQVKAWLR